MIYCSLILNSSVGPKFISLGSNWCFSLTHGVNQLSFQLERAESSLTQSFVLGNCFHCAFKREGREKPWLLTSSFQVRHSWGLNAGLGK